MTLQALRISILGTFNFREQSRFLQHPSLFRDDIKTTVIYNLFVFGKRIYFERYLNKRDHECKMQLNCLLSTDNERQRH